ncbi:pyridoxamine 5'-phosphate oxidase family protein [Pedobacter sp. MC2016-15]|uniref:pyridoxamine 5'-phosphate oxidase family protein n=1 Tax=Pedobacter sp. MC2016-15 TaxID=2994473 RepID=UPI002247F8A9|nr:pyridoxamine 5'-phosphate oxidase family protein [Pedobacter sp. MC2016-15]MCX2480629.1 pyridoxamine 5'-phosphate oxidase family protein [Pedobacter sp. MC2016-15]
MENVYHDGELEIQKRVGEAEIADQNKKLVTPFIVKGAINFVEKQPMAVVGSRNQEGELWASILIGNFGFVKVADPALVVFDREKLVSNPDDIFYGNISTDNQIGSLFIELDSRKRLRVNGSVTMEGSKIELSVDQSYPNCPKYIQRRVISMPEYFEKTQSGTSEGVGLTEVMISWIRDTDTFFVASAGEDGHLDVSHRGGNPGFLQVDEDGVLKIPDYPGASFFNTFGNVLQNPKVGLLFIDFEKRETLQLTGTASLLFDQNAEDDLLRTKGTGRFWLFKPARWIHTLEHHRVGWSFLEYSPFNP